MKSVTNWFKRRLSFDHRKAQRMKSPLLVAYYWDGATPTSHAVQDISSTGFYLLTKECWPLGTIVTMTLQRTDIVHGNPGAEPHIGVLSKVVRLGEDGVGFALIPVETQHKGLKSGPVDKKALVRFLAQLKLDWATQSLGALKQC